MTPRPPRRRSGSSLLLGSVLVLVIVLSGILLLLSARAQDRLSHLREGQTNGAQQRGDQLEVTCALWETLRSDPDARDITTDLRKSADRICDVTP